MSAGPRATVGGNESSFVSGELWRELAGAIARAGELVIGPDAPASPRDRAEGFRYLARFLDAGLRLCVTHAERDAPRFARFVEPLMTWGLDHPDCCYHHAEIEGGASYRIFGNRGSANHFDVQVNAGHFANGALDGWKTVSTLSGFELGCAPDGGFELFVSPEKRPGNWLETRGDAEFVLVRQYFADWEGERPADLEIERLGAPRPPPPPDPGDLARRFERLRTWLEKGGALWTNMSRLMLALPPNTLRVADPRAAGERAGLRGQAYGIGNFRCGPDEAVCLEFTPPRCHHWTVNLANFFWESLDLAHRQSSLNAHQAVLSRDGAFRAVIAHRDPGVANWLDTSGITAGTLSARFLLADAAPHPRLRAVPFAALERELPADTPRIAPLQRAEALAARRRGMANRFRS